jgi:hypothetical protein
MIVLRRRVLVVLALTLPGVALVAGCGDGKPSMDTSLTEATVSGIVSVKGVPATGGGNSLQSQQCRTDRPHSVRSDRTGRDLYDKDTDGNESGLV